MTDPNALTQIEFDIQTAQSHAVSVLELLEDEGCEVAMGAIIMALNIGKLLSPKPLSMEEEIAYLQAVLEFTAAYFTSGTSN